VETGMEVGRKEDDYKPRPFQMVVQGQLNFTRKKGKAAESSARNTGKRKSTRAIATCTYEPSKKAKKI
jgi:hypothetical protein